MKTVRLVILLALSFAGCVSLLYADAYPIKGGIAFIVIIVLGYLLNKKGLLFNLNDIGNGFNK